MSEMIRNPAVASAFYEGTRSALNAQIEECYTHQLGPGRVPSKPSKPLGKILGIVTPHAGYTYSGPVAAWAFCQLIEKELPESVVLLGPNHYGLGREVAVMPAGRWRTPLGEVEVDEDLASKIAESSFLLELDDTAHRKEHSLEVQLPFLQHGYGEAFKIVPISIMSQDLESAQEIGKALGEALKGRRGALIVASTDLTHYEPAASANTKDAKVIEAILSMDPARVEEVVSKLSVSMCGPGPVMAMLTAASLLGAQKARLLKYASSGDITGDYSAVVGYASLAIEK